MPLLYDCGMGKRFIIFVIDDSTNSGTPEEMIAIDAFNDKLRENGQWIFAGGLANYTSGNVIDNRNNVNTETGKALFDVQENYSGFWLIETNDAETARRLAYEGSRACNRKVELRALLG
jgi:hypothetical protein